MQYLTCGSLNIPLCFVTGFSYSKRAKTIEHAGGFVSSRGFEASEISVKIQVARSTAEACSLRFSEWFTLFDELEAEKRGEQGVVYLGGFPIYPELNFALTNINKTMIRDASDVSPAIIEADLIFSGVSCVKEVSRERALSFEPSDVWSNIPKITISCNGKSLEVQDSITVSRFNTTPTTLELDLNLGQDTQTAERESFLTALIDQKAIVQCDLPQGITTYHVIQCLILDNELSIWGSVFPETANQTITKTFIDCDISEIIEFNCQCIGIESNVLVHGNVAFYLQNANPIEALQELQNSAGFIISIQGNRLTASTVPAKIEASEQIDGMLTDDSIQEQITGVIWRDGENEFMIGNSDGQTVKLQSCFSSSDQTFAENVLAYRQYMGNLLVLETPLNTSIQTHSCISIVKNGELINVLCDRPSFDWLNGTMAIECRGV